MTTAERTAYDLARQDDLAEAVVAVDTLAHNRFAPQVLEEIASRHPGDRRIRRLPRVLALADARSDSPMESRIRLAIVRYGLPLPVLQHPVVPGTASRRSSTTDVNTSPRSGLAAICAEKHS